MRRRANVLAVSLLATLSLGPLVHATCGSAGCFLVTGTEQGLTGTGKLGFDLSYRYVDQDVKLAGSDDVPEVLAPKIDFETGEIEPDHHREIRTQNTAVLLGVTYGMTERLTLAVSLPLVQDRDHEHFDEVGTEEEHFSGSDGQRGLGDLQAGVRGALLVGERNLLLGTLMVKAPTGAYRLLDSEGAVAEPTLQPGTGSWDGIAGLHWTRLRGDGNFEWFASGSYRRNGTNDLEYRMGSEVLLSAGARFRAGAQWEPSLQLNLRDAGRDRFLGGDVPSTGSQLWNLTPGVRYRRESGGSFYTFLQIPVHQEVNETQLAPRYGMVLGATF